VRGRLRVNVSSYFARLVVAPRITAFLDAHPELALELVVRDRLGDLVSDGFDVAVRFGEPEPSSLVARKILETRILTCAAPSYLLRRGRPRHPRELESGRHECVQFLDAATGRPFAWEFQRRGRRPLRVRVAGRLVVNDVETALAACVAGQGITQPMELVAGELLRSKALVQLFPEWAEERFPLYVYHPSRHLMPAKVRAFVDFVVALARAVG
jgi:DNA-binding transcriptional LysR family regulator